MQQGTEEWHQVRGMLPTASNFGKILTATGKASTQADGYMNGLIAHWLGAWSDTMDGYKSDWMERGNDMEDEAVAWFEMSQNTEVVRPGFCLRDDKAAGCSPDGLIGRIGLELKCPKASVHVGYLINQKLPTMYIPQVQGSMYVTGFRQWWFMSYHPELEPLLILIDRDEGYCAALERAIVVFNNRMQARQGHLLEMGYKAA